MSDRLGTRRPGGAATCVAPLSDAGPFRPAAFDSSFLIRRAELSRSAGCSDRAPLGCFRAPGTSEFQQVLAKLWMRIRLAHQAALLQRRYQPVFDLRDRPTADIGQGEQEPVAADLLHRFRHLRRNTVGRADQLYRSAIAVISVDRLT